MLSISDSFLNAATHIPNSFMNETVLLKVLWGEGDEYGPVPLSDLGHVIGRLIGDHGTPSPATSQLSAPVQVTVNGYTGTSHYRALADVREEDGRVRFVFEDLSAVSFKSLAYEPTDYRPPPRPSPGFEMRSAFGAPSYVEKPPTSPTLVEGATFQADSGRNYVVRYEIGRGGTAIVHAVRSVAGTYAAKCLMVGRFSLDVLVDRFEREVANLAKVTHENVIKYIDQAYRGPRLILVMETADGSLHDRIKLADFELHEAAQWVFEILSGLSEIHTCGLVHRDLSPKNVLFVGTRPKIADFGTTRCKDDDDLTSDLDRIAMGSLIYISAEQRKDPHSVEFSDDVFSAGQIAYELFTGNPPTFNAPPMTSYDGFPEGLAKIIERMRAYKRADRYDDATQALNDFVRWRHSHSPL